MISHCRRKITKDMILGFKDRFVPYVMDGSKRHTIRAGNRWRAGMRADLFARPRQKGMRLLFRAPVVKVEEILIRAIGASGIHVVIDDLPLTQDETESLFERDGFRKSLVAGTSSEQALSFWRNRLPFAGQIIHWDYERRQVD